MENMALGSLHMPSHINKGAQILLRLRYRELVTQGLPLPLFHDVEFRNFSQNGEDGILHYIFSLIGTTNRRVVEMCAGNGIQCNATNLLINHGWRGYLFDGDKNNVTTGSNFFRACADTFIAPPVFQHAWITAENVNQLLAEQEVAGEIDLLSLDLDGVDYWIWKALDIISPRVVILEFQGALGANVSCTVPYEPEFRADFAGQIGPLYCGASLAAFTKLAEIKGYRLIGVNSYYFNAFFIRKDIAEDILPEVSVPSCLLESIGEQQAEAVEWVVSQFPWVEV
jgi:hypothetical protein